ncbi:uncharacterized protein LOC127086859 [Lathyrus oleraceus]|uniref:uncharacterized protein LOC127086859 n=1 Tax=Pisum sativum TaxID=3888 RepID=UPI0021CEECAD|nr:uncharacterized protein LOC127086859 [Pisum sativum]
MEDVESNIEPARTELNNPQANKGPSIRIHKDLPKELIIGNLDEGVTTRSKDVISKSCFVSKLEPKNVKEDLTNKLSSKLDINFGVGVCARYQAEPKISHITQVKRILKYINGTSKYVVHETPIDSKKDDPDDKSMYVDEEKNLSEEEEITSVKKDKYTNIINVDDLDSDDEPIRKRLALSIAKRLRNKTWRDDAYASKAFKLPRKVLLLDLLKKAVGKKVPANVPEVPIDNIFFHSVENVEKLKFMYQRRLALERELVKDALEYKEVISLIENAGLMKSVVRFRKYYEMLVINMFMGRCEDEQVEVEVTDNIVYKEITAKLVSQWPIKGNLSTSKLSVKTKTKFDFGSYIFKKTLKHASTFAVKILIDFPSLICGIILSQQPESPLSLHYRLFAGTHVPNIVMTSGKETASSTSKDGIIVGLKDTCKDLDETIKTCTEMKIILERLIKALTEEGTDGNMVIHVEEENDEDENSDADVATETNVSFNI